MEISKEKPRLIKTWQELNECLSETHVLEIDLEFGTGWIISKKPTGVYYKDNLYLSTHSFYGSDYEKSTKVLQKCGFNVVLENWDK